MNRSRPLTDIDPSYWGNSILFQLAKALDKAPSVIGDVESPEISYVVDPDELLAETLGVIRKYKELI